MAQRIRVTTPVGNAIRVTTPAPPCLEPNEVAAALGADPVLRAKLEPLLGPVTLLALRTELANRLRSTGGRPALAGADMRAKVPLADGEWKELDEMAAALSTPGCSPSAGQVAGALLSLSVRAVKSQLAAETPGRPG